VGREIGKTPSERFAAALHVDSGGGARATEGGGNVLVLQAFDEAQQNCLPLVLAQSTHLFEQAVAKFRPIEGCIGRVPFGGRVRL
jgi:hypothetical protein